MQYPFDVLEFINSNKQLVKRYLAADTRTLYVPDFNTDKQHYYKNNVTILRSGVAFEYTELQKLEYIKCMRDVVYFTRKYVKIISIDEGLIPFDLYNFQEKLLDLYQKNRFVISMQCRQSGKMIDLDTPIMTPNGFVRNGDLKVGDKVFGRNGLQTEVTFISEQRNDMNQYELEFDNGEKIKACGEHLWAYNSSSKKLKEVVQNTEEMIAEFERMKSRSSDGTVWINITKPLMFDYKSVPIDPYTFGMWLGDGDAAEGRITSNIDDFGFYKNYMDVGKFSIDKRTNSTGSFTVKGLRKALRLNGILNNKHIPEVYMHNSVQVRLALLQGLMDSDGYVDKGGSCEFYQKDKKLIDQVRLLLSSLGIKSRIKSYKVKGYPDDYWTLAFTTPVEKFEVFRLPRKLERQRLCKSHPKNERIYLKSYRKLDDYEKVYMQCLTVADDDHMFLCGETLLPTHNTATTAAYILHYATFNASKTVAILANKASQAREILSRVQLSYEGLPFFLKQGVITYNKGSTKFGNLSEIFCGASSSSSIRGRSISLLYIDECAFLRGDMEFYESTYPTISSGKESRIIVTSTPNGARGLFYKLWSESVDKINMFKNMCVPWNLVPGRDNAWKAEQIANTSAEQFNQEHGLIFRGSQNSLLSSDTLAMLPISRPESVYGDLLVYEEPIPNHTYFTTVDTSRGVGGDYSAFCVFDITEVPYTLVACYRNNRISPMIYPQMIKSVCDKYNESFVLVEVNDIGEQVANILYHDFEYENILMCFSEKNTQKIGFVKDARVGVRTTTQVKSIGCSNVKTMIETDKLILNDETTINEFGTFVPRGRSYEADSGANDDMVMCCVLFAWASTQQYFIDLTDRDISKNIRDSMAEQMMEDLLPFGIFDNGIVEFDGVQMIDRPQQNFY